MVTLIRMSYMTRIILTTCGTSLFQTSCWKYKDLDTKYSSQIEDMNERDKQEKLCETWLGLARDDNEDISSSFDRTPWDNSDYRRDLPAELASLRAIQVYFESLKDEEPLGKGDKVILLHSDNKDGKYCAEMIHKVLTDEEFKLLPEVEIDEWEVKGLDPADSDEFISALSSIWSGCIQQFPKKNENTTEYIFNLTGGYKGVAILLGAFAYSNGLDVSIFYLYEETNYEVISIIEFDNTEPDKNKRFRVSSVDVNGHRRNPPHGDPTTPL